MIQSDLHLDHHLDDFKPRCDKEASTTLILAGDIIGLNDRYLKDAIVFFSDAVARFKHVIYVTGNHEYYGTSWEAAHYIRTKLECQVEANTGKRLLMSEEYDEFTLDGQRFLCGTGWVPMPAKGTPDITDAYAIKRYKPEVFRRHKTFGDGIETNLKSTDIVISHHLPSNRSVAPPYYGDIYNAWFVAPLLEKFILNSQPKLWIHGHTHHSFDYHIGATRVLCNPRGYPNESSSTFNPSLVIDI